MADTTESRYWWSLSALDFLFLLFAVIVALDSKEHLCPLSESVCFVQTHSRFMHNNKSFLIVKLQICINLSWTKRSGFLLIYGGHHYGKDPDSVSSHSAPSLAGAKILPLVFVLPID